jgi:hypothetical protein
MEKAVIITDMGKSLVIPPVTVRIPMPQGAGTPPPSPTPAQAPSQARPTK